MRTNRRLVVGWAGAFFRAICFLSFFGSFSYVFAASGQWSSDKADQWYARQAWLVGSDYITSTAVNELEMWQADTFDLPTIDSEFGWAQRLGMNTMRVFLHNLLWQQDSQGFLRRMDQFVEVADKHHVRIMFVLSASLSPWQMRRRQQRHRSCRHRQKSNALI